MEKRTEAEIKAEIAAEQQRLNDLLKVEDTVIQKLTDLKHELLETGVTHG